MEVESEEEQITNKLMSRLSMLTQEKRKLEQKVRVAETQLDQMTRDLGAQRRSAIDLQQQIDDINSEKESLESRLLQDRTSLVHQISQTLEDMTHSIDRFSENGEEEMVSSLRTQLSVLRDTYSKLARESQSLKEQNEQLNKKLLQAENESFLLSQRYRREQEKSQEMLITSMRADMDDELLMERAFTTQRMRSNSSATGDKGGTTTGLPPLPLSVGVEIPSIATVHRRRSGSSFVLHQLESPRSAATGEPSPLQQMMNNNYNEPMSAATSPRISLSPRIRGSPTTAVATNISLSAPQPSFMERYLSNKGGNT